MNKSTAPDAGGVPVSKVSKGLYSIGPLGHPPVITLYLLDGKKPCLIDSGPSSVVADALAGAEKLGFAPGDFAFVALTHIHIDHAGGAWLLSRKLPNATILVPKRGIRHLIEPTKLNESARRILGDIFDAWGPVEPLDSRRAISIGDNEFREVGGRRLQYVWAPGHAVHHMVIVDSENNEVFAADALGIYHPNIDKISPTTPSPGFDYERALEDIHRIELMKPKRVFLSHFQPVYANTSFFEMVKSIYGQWYKTIQDGLDAGSSIEELMNLIDQKFPEYQLLSHALRKQLLRVDVTGYVDYLQRMSKKQTATVMPKP
jgi:glyoxylase-like metal-dependent hydrolase (beta-lactamase superfamily II)